MHEAFLDYCVVTNLCETTVVGARHALCVMNTVQKDQKHAKEVGVSVSPFKLLLFP